MIADARNADLLAEWADSIENDGTKEAFLLLVGAASALRSMTCHPQFKGTIRDFRFIDTNGEQPFSFITNKSSLLFYFRPPSVRSGAYAFDRLKAAFESASTNPKGEWTVRLESIDDVQRLRRYLELR
ncbi:MAG: hypothetical protein U1E28_00165 [Beijerinckiaceae bacterium]